MTDELNLYGDRLVSTTGSHGADISTQRLDDLDKRALSFIISSEEEQPIVCDIGCGSGAQGFRFALLGARVHMFDIIDLSNTLVSFQKIFPYSNISYHRGDVISTFPQSGARGLQAAYSQRTLHYMPYDAARLLCREIRSTLEPGGKFFLSVSGIGSELSKGYTCKDLSLEERFGTLDYPIALKHQIHEPVCLYSASDVDRLARESGFTSEIWSSPFGNIKAVLS